MSKSGRGRTVSTASKKSGSKSAKVLSLLVLISSLSLDLATAQIARKAPPAYTAPRVAAVSPTSGGLGLDLVVLVDQSASMSGLGRKAGSDASQIRNLLLGLTLDLIARNGESNRVSHRLGVVSFGSTARIDLPLTEIQRDDLGQLRRRVETAPSRKSLGNTDILAAFAVATRMFDVLPAEPVRKRAILLITDGVPYVPGTDVLEYSRDLRRFVATNFPPLQNTIEVLVLPPPGRDRGQRHSQLWRDLSHDRVHELVGDRGDKFAVLHRVVTRLVGTSAVESWPAGAEEKRVEIIILPPYLDLVVFDIFRGPGRAEVAVFAPDTLRPLTSEVEGVEEVRLGEIFQTVVVRHPMPGQWTFRKSNPDSRVKVFSQQFFPRGILVDPTAAKALRQYDRIAVAYRVIDGNGLPLKELPGYPLSLEVSLVKPDGGRDTLGMKRQPELGPAVFRTRKEAECHLAGRYWTEVLVTTKDLNDQRVKVFQDHWSGFLVAAASRIDCRVTAPGFGEPMLLQRWILWAQPVATRLKCLDPKAQPIEMKSLVRGSPTRLFQPLLSHEGQPTEAALDLEYLGRGAFQGWLRGAGSPGFYRLQLSVD
ncbi:MAG TPA: vWA domain-containing protein, partial [Thermoanaerobaculia bacterium]|nr:vWA domain-containing protein [Thermoanaerobaculia bacterium]